MPGGDRTGPLGEGPQTGRRMGYCAGFEHPGFMNMNQGWGRGIGRKFRGGFNHGRGPGYGYGYGYGFRHGYGGSYPQGDIPEVSEKTWVENEIRILKDQLAALEDRLSKIGKNEKG
jgi:hypothetical protein